MRLFLVISVATMIAASLPSISQGAVERSSIGRVVRIVAPQNTADQTESPAAATRPTTRPTPESQPFNVEELRPKVPAWWAFRFFVWKLCVIVGVFLLFFFMLRRRPTTPKA